VVAGCAAHGDVTDGAIGAWRVAALAADGLSNRQIAQHLFISQATVETHLRHAFQKLGITSRGSLPPLAHHIAAPAQLQT
jgi:FixJ family two-component response regulator